MTGYLDPHGARAFLGNKSMAWLRLHLHEIPHLKLYDRLLFDPVVLREWVERTAVKCDPVDVDRVVADVLGPRQKRKEGKR